MYKRFLLLILGVIAISCDSDIDAGNFVVGSEFLQTNNNVILVDTFAVNVSTIQIDSLVTSSRLRIAVGSYTDPIFGKVEAKSYFQLTGDSYSINATSSDTDGSSYVFDSIRMVMKLDRYYYGDTLKVHSFDIHRLQQNVKATLEDGTFHNDSNLTYDAEILGTVSYKPKPNSQDSVSVALSSVFGRALFQKLRSNQIANSDEFVEYFKGFVITPTAGNSSSVMGFNLASELRLYYSKSPSESETSLVKTFNITDAAKQFNNFKLDKTGTVISDLPSSTLNLSSLKTGNKSYIQSGTGVACRVEIPNIKQLKRLYTNGVIVDAQLTIKPANGTYTDNYPLPDSLQVYVVDHLNRIKSSLTTSSGAAAYAILNTKKDEFNETIGYTVSVGSFLQSELLRVTDQQYSLLFVLPNLTKGVNRVVLADQASKENKLQLKLYYISY
ncbi:hypothetical protein FFWV33_01675 [Flavobacterium faecale]|uniref:DUF4270 domain-containing protein n=1 Tax=Flavobacterium faecale TaxID=1355330 RepID=A0A2S1L997_9FLAO|nr:DUF4270 family protein [Flavobacterium faecale]AWG20322.1 hypothetical protein FFWV33_01675 [Flavobacterium faecale]